MVSMIVHSCQVFNWEKRIRKPFVAGGGKFLIGKTYYKTLLRSSFFGIPEPQLLKLR